MDLKGELYSDIIKFLRTRLPNIAIHSNLGLPPTANSIALTSNATSHDYVIINGFRFHASAGRNSEPNTLITIRMLEQDWIGELQQIFNLQQPGLGVHRFGKVRWLKPVGDDLVPRLWADL